MKRATFAAFALAAGTVLAATAFAAPSGDAPSVPSLAPLMQKEIHWGMNHLEVVEAYNHPTGLFDKEYAPQLAKLQPGVQMDELTSDRENRKSNFAHAYNEFLDTPTGYDLTPLKSEYTYDNGEALQKLYKDGKTRFFFYIKDHLWKIYDEVPLKADGPLGESFQAAVTRLGGVVGTPPRLRNGGSPGVERTTADWQDSSTHLRVVDLSSDHMVGVVLEDKHTIANLSSLRSNKPRDLFALDPSVAAITKNGVSDPNAAHQNDVDAGARRRK
jgi:hypothetical protein